MYCSGGHPFFMTVLVHRAIDRCAKRHRITCWV